MQYYRCECGKHFYTENGNIDTIRMIDKPTQEPLPKTVADGGQKILAFYTSKMSANDFNHRWTEIFSKCRIFR